MNKEFHLIQHYFKSRTQERSDVILGIGDDAALLKAPRDTDIAVSIDALVEGIHFTSDMPARELGYRSLAMSLSDMAAMGAQPAWVMLSLILPKIDAQWLDHFSTGFFELMDEYALELVGGNVSAGPLSVTSQVMGFLPKDTGVRRSGAKPGDLIYVTGTLGDAGLALYLIKQQRQVSAYLQSRFYRPTPRVKEGMLLCSKANAMIDVSDGLVSDLQHILEQSHVGATVWVERLPLSSDMKKVVQDLPGDLSFAYELALSAGDDYELCFTLPPAQQEATLLNCTCIGVVEASAGLNLIHEGHPFVLKKSGYQHFD